MAIDWRTFETDVREFHRLPSLLTAGESAILIDGPFLRSSGERVRDAILASGKTLEAIVVTCVDPDFYFGLTPICAAFPDVPVRCPSPIVAGIRASVDQKAAFWGAEHRDEIPALADIVIPTPFDEPSMLLNGETIEIVTTPQDGYFHLWLPAQKVILGGVQVSSDNHVWMADFPLAEQRRTWLLALENMLALDPVEVLPGHLPPGAPTGTGAVRFTIAYIKAFEEELARATGGDALIAAMTARYPALAMPFILDLGARVCMGEQQWP